MDILYILLVILVVTRACGELAIRLQQPELIGHLIGGILLSVIISQFPAMFPLLSMLSDNEVFIAITDLGVFFLMLVAGIHMRPRELVKASGSAFAIALSGLLVPLLAGVALAWYYIPDSDWKFAQVMFVGTALAITAIPVVAKVLMEMGELQSRLGKTIMSAALFDDVLGLILLAILTALIGAGEPMSATGLGFLLLRVMLFFGIVTIIGLYLVPLISNLLKFGELENLEFSLLLVVGLSFAVIAELLELHFILGAFMAGLFFRRRHFGKKTYKDVQRKTTAISDGFLAPIFFASIGLHLNVTALVEIPVFVILFIILAMVSKMIGAGAAALATGARPETAASIGVGMSARGAVELIIADIALRAGLFNNPQPLPEIVEHLYSATVIMAIVTTLLMPVGFRYFLKKRQAYFDDSDNASSG